jgi:predicted nucleic acid-binding protein
MPDSVFIDTWGWVALGHRKDARHHKVKALYKEMRSQGGRLYTSDYVLDELITLLFRREVFKEAVRFVEGLFHASEQRLLTIERITSDRFASTWALRTKLQDKPRISYTDLSSMAVMEELGIERVLTDDEHFEHVGMGFRKCP